MTCKLCLENKPLKNSHIISEAFYTSVYDQKHRAFTINMQNEKLRLIQKGITEKLLCESCEQKFSKWETVVKNTLIALGDKQSNSLEFACYHQYKDFFKVENIKYKEFKLGILSILWRMSIASDDFFESYSLGDSYEEKLRKILLSESLVDETKYPISVTRYEIDGIFYPGLILSFDHDRYEIFHVQSFVIWGHHFRIFVNDRRVPKLPIDLFLRNSGQLYIDIDSLPRLASPNNVFAKLYDEKVENMFSRLKYK